MDKLKKIVADRFFKTMIELNKVGAKKATRDIVKSNLDILQVEVEAEIAKSADALKNRLVIRSLEDTLKEFKLMVERGQ